MSKPLPSIIVQGAIDILSDPNRWCRGAEARRAPTPQCTVGKHIRPTSKLAVAFCAIGAIKRSAYDICEDATQARRLAYDAIDEVGRHAQRPISCINDFRGREAVVTALKNYLASKE